MGIPVIKMFGMGCDGAVTLHRWLTDPSTRDFELEDLTVLTAMTGNEWRETGKLVEDYIYPMLREQHIRTVQIMKAGPKVSDGYTVLDDSREPTKCYLYGRYDHPLGAIASRWIDLDADTSETLSLGEYLLQKGTVPQYSEKRRDCSPKAKGQLLESWVHDTHTLSLGELMLSNGNARTCSDRSKIYVDDTGLPVVRVAIGFNADERYRIERAEFSQAKKKQKVRRLDFYPLAEAGLGRLFVEDYATNIVARGERRYIRSACVYCPFSGIAGPKEETLEKHRLYPEESGIALLVEHISRRMNPKQTLYPSGRSLYQMMLDDENYAALAYLEQYLDMLPWAVYRVQRIYGFAIPYRKTQIVETGSRYQTESRLEAIAHRFNAQLDTQPDGIPRAYIERREDSEGYDQSCEDLLVACPAVVLEKHRPGWDMAWHKARRKQLEFDLPGV